MLRSIGAVIAGYFTLAVLTAGTIFLLGTVFPASYTPTNTGWVLFNLLYGALYAVLGGYVTGLIAQRAEVRHGLALGIVMVVLSIVTFVLTQTGPTPTGQPLWYSIALVVLALPTPVLGGYLRNRQRTVRGA
jgi:hypothetical protein